MEAPCVETSTVNGLLLEMEQNGHVIVLELAGVLALPASSGGGGGGGVGAWLESEHLIAADGAQTITWAAGSAPNAVLAVRVNGLLQSRSVWTYAAGALSLTADALLGIDDVVTVIYE